MRKKFLGIICLLYALIIIFVNRYNILRNFLAPNMQIYLKAAVIPLIILGLVILFSEKINFKFKLTDLVLILPLIMLIYAGDGRLTTSFASNRSSNIKIEKKVVEKEKEEEILEKKEEDNSEVDFSNVYFDIKDDIYLDLANYLTYSSKASNKFVGKTIRVRGFTIDDNSYLPKGYYGLGKYGVSCCAADAGFMGFIIKSETEKIKKDTWYEVEGVLEEGKDLAGYNILVIKVVNIKEIDGKTEEQYIYPCYGYGDGSCSKIKEYNLEY